MDMVRRECAGIDTEIHVVAFDSLLMDFAERSGASVIIRGLRAVADFEYEYQMAGMNQQLNSRIETVFLMADVSLQPIARSEEHTSELQSLMRISYAVFCLKK